MPTEDHRKVRLLLKAGQAKVVQRTPFTIQLLHTTHVYKQNINLGVDTGSKTIGLSATTSKKELFAEEVAIRNDIVELLSARRELRQSRRNRTTRYRKQRFLNRVKSKKKNWLSPSIRAKIAYHLKVVDKVYKLLPITKLIVETASFDTQKILNPGIEGIEYQQGPQLGFWNVREYVLFRDNHECQYCHGKSKDKVLNVHHIVTRKTGGNSPNNLITLCETCHKKYHNGEIKLKVTKPESLKDAAFMSTMRWRLYSILKERYLNVKQTFGYITKNIRIENRLSKGHCIDARCISGNPLAKPVNMLYLSKVVRRHNRQIHKATVLKGGYRKNNQAPKYVFGYQLFDKVYCKGQIGFIFGRRSSGSFDVRHLDGTRISKSITYKKIRLLEYRTTMLIEEIVRESLSYS